MTQASLALCSPRTTSLALSCGHYSDAGRKAENQDCHGSLIPSEPQLTLKGAAFAIADGISTSSVSQIASETAVKSFLDDYFCTSDAWSVQHAGSQVLRATNAWLYAQTQNSPFRYHKDKGYVCTLSALVLKGGRAHILHAGDSRIYRLRGGALEQLTRDHRVWLSEQKSYLSRALGADEQIAVDYQSLPLQAGDRFLLTTDGVHEELSSEQIIELLDRHNGMEASDLDLHAELLARAALEAGSDDNLTVQLVRVDALPSRGADLSQQVDMLPLPPSLQARDRFDGYRISRQLHATSRSHIYLALDEQSGEQVILKTPSIDLGGDPAYLERLLREEWIARRVNSAHVIKAGASQRPRNYLYTVSEYIDGQTLRQWMIDNPEPELETVRGIVEQIARGLQALHRAEIIHQDLRPDNVMIDASGTVKLIDLGSALVAGIEEAALEAPEPTVLGTALYTAPEQFLGELGSRASDLYSLAVLTYHLLSGQFPYGMEVAKCRTQAQQHKLRYRSLAYGSDELTDGDSDSANNDKLRSLPRWVDETLRHALHPNPYKRTQELSEFIYDLRHPNRRYLRQSRPPLMQRHPLRFWQGVSAVLAVTVVVLLAQLTGS
ncbi:bifunctional protein-serine/threonine kinase/phosphatase [Motiliproteus sediminis]|uniref:bifunctional protein-serine/threonine kinase/phosphatase n=1 Tax=Motiliproteus sediminis TaxID=1468178 RepID=UPI001AEFB59A|nr:bifunctional protein-serine/threonine kinase/phosphatase [Motiliproteus sediminis]